MAEWVGRAEAGRAYLAAEAAAQGQEAREEVLAPSDHTREAPAQPSHADPEGGCLGQEARGRRVRRGAEKQLLPERGWGRRRVGRRQRCPGCPGSSARPEQPARPAPSSGRRSTAGAQQCGSRSASISPEAPAGGASTLRDFLRCSLSPPLSVTASLLPAALAGCRGGHRHLGNFRGSWREPRRRGRSDEGRGGARRQAST